MYTDEEVANNNKLAAHPLPLPTIDESEDTPPFTQSTDGLNLEPNPAQAHYDDTNNWGSPTNLVMTFIIVTMMSNHPLNPPMSMTKS